MSSSIEMLKSVEAMIELRKNQESKLSDILAHFPGVDVIDELVEVFEEAIAVLLIEQQGRYLSLFRAFIGKTEQETLQAILAFFSSEVFSYDPFVEGLSTAAKDFLQMSVEEFAKTIMYSLDPDVPFQILSRRSVTWIEEWSADLAKLMNISTQNEVEKVLVNAIESGKGIDVVERELMDLPGFDRKRARNTAITEILTASSVAHQESYAQSPSVVGKKWKHSGTKGINPRKNHMELDGTVVPVDEPFTIPGSGELAMHPRDTNLSAKERVNCHCVLGPDVDENIFGLSAEEKLQLREEALKDLNEKSTSNIQNDIIEEDFKEIIDYEAWEEDVSEEWTKKLTINEQMALNEYTGKNYKQINEYLRSHEAYHIDTSNNSLDETIDLIDSGINKFELKEDILVYRGMRNNIWHIPPDKLTGLEFWEDGFMSTTIRKEFMFGGNVQMTLRVPKGTSGAYINSVSRFNDEYEFLLNRDTSYRIVEANEKDNIIHVIAEVINGD